MVGFVFLQREFLEWEWYQSPEVSPLYIHLLLKISFVIKKWKGVVFTMRQLITSLDNLLVGLKLSIQGIKTTLSKLEKGSYILKQTTNYSNDENNVEHTFSGLVKRYGYSIYDRLFEMFPIVKSKRRSYK